MPGVILEMYSWIRDGLIQKGQVGNMGENAIFHSVFVEETQALQIIGIQPVIDVLRQVLGNQLGREIQFGRPGRGNFRNVL